MTSARSTVGLFAKVDDHMGFAHRRSGELETGLTQSRVVFARSAASIVSRRITPKTWRPWRKTQRERRAKRTVAADGGVRPAVCGLGLKINRAETSRDVDQFGRLVDVGKPVFDGGVPFPALAASDDVEGGAVGVENGGLVGGVLGTRRS